MSRPMFDEMNATASSVRDHYQVYERWLAEQPALRAHYDAWAAAGLSPEPAGPAELSAEPAEPAEPADRSVEPAPSAQPAEPAQPGASPRP